MAPRASSTRDLGPLFEVLAAKLAEPAAQLEAFLTVGVLDHAVERDVLRAAHDDLSHVAFPFVGVVSYHWGRHRGSEKMGDHQPPSSRPGRCLYQDGSPTSRREKEKLRW